MHNYNHTNEDSLLIGVIIDVSGSMKENWKNEKIKAPTIEVIRDAINDEIKAFNEFHPDHILKNTTEIFCLGFGFRYSENITYKEHKNKRGRPKEISTSIDINDVVCDILALNEMIPRSELLYSLEEELNNRWNKYSQALLENEIILESNPAEKILTFLEISYKEDYLKKVENGFSNRIILKYNLKRFSFFNSLYQKSLLKIEHWKLMTQSKAESYSHYFLEKVQNESIKIFYQNRSFYIQLIQKELNEFASKSIFEILFFVSMGFSLEHSIQLLNESKVEEIATKILKSIHSDVNKKIGLRWRVELSRELKLHKKVFHASFKNKEVHSLVEKCFQKFGWDILEPFVKEEISNLFKKCFQSEIEKMIPHWIKEASSKNVTRYLKDISYLLPEKLDSSIYSDRYMFGSTPIMKTLFKASQLFLDKNNRVKNKILVIISDGDFENDSEAITDMLKQENVLVITCLVHNKDLIDNLKEKISKELPENTRRMLRLASTVNPDHKILKALKKNNIILHDNHILGIQMNHSENLQLLIRVLLGDYDKMGL